MATYVLRRVLLMIPTVFGISLVVWLVMVLSPGRLGGSGGGMGQGSMEDLGKDATKLAQENEAERLFRRQFGLDRPAFLNFWYDLTADDVREEIRTAHYDEIKPAGMKPVSIGKKGEARHRLEDYGYFAVPAMVELVQQTEGVEQTYVRYWLGRNAHRQTIKRYGQALTQEEVDRARAWTKENRMLSQWKWEIGTPAEERTPVVEKWKNWYTENQQRWDKTGWEKFKTTVTDTQFGTYWGRLAKGDLGYSHLYKQPVVDLIGERIKYSLSLNVVALLISFSLAVPLGIFTAAKQGSVWDKSIGIVLFMLYSLPNYFLGTLLIKWLAAGEPWTIFPTGSFEASNSAELSTLEHFKSVLWHVTLPLVCLSYVGLAGLSRFARSGMLDVIRSDYVRTARAKGLSGFTVVMKHVVRNGILPIVTILGGTLPIIIGGSIAIEYIFNIDGMGLLIINSILQKDFNVVMGVQLIVGILTMIGILLADIAYAALDPRISLS